MNPFLEKIAITVIAGLILFVVTLPLNNKINDIKEIAIATQATVELIVEVLEIDPDQVRALAEAMSTGAERVGDGVGDGAATAIDSIGNAIQKWRADDN